MKIDSNSPSIASGATDAVTAPGHQRSGAAASNQPPAQRDQVTLSPEARLLQAAASTTDGPVVRGDVVARMRELMETGELGADATKLADAVIANWLTTP